MLQSFYTSIGKPRDVEFLRGCKQHLTWTHPRRVVPVELDLYVAQTGFDYDGLHLSGIAEGV